MSTAPVPAPTSIPPPAAPVREPFSWLPKPMRPGAVAVRRFAKPFLLIQGAAFVAVVAYYTVPAFARALEAAAAWKDRGGMPLAAALAAFAGGVLPELAKSAVSGDWRFDRKRVDDLVFNACFFAVLSGILTDGLYKLLAHTVGQGTDWLTVLTKTAIDQVFFTTFFSIPFSFVVYRWRANRYDLGHTLRQLRPVRQTYLTRVVPLVVPAWFYWTPMVLLVYSLPTPLQFVLFVFALAAWSLILVVLATGGDTRAAAAKKLG